MTKARLLLVVSESGGITDVARAARRVTYQAVADKIGAELLVTAEGCGAQLLDVPLLAPDPLVEPTPPDNPFMRYSEKTREAFRMVELLLNQGAVKLVRDSFSQGELRFLSPNSRQPSALLTVAAAEVVESKVSRYGALLCGLLAGAVSAVAVGAGLMWLGKLWL